ncbi:ATP-grasp domain-containing protein [Natrinema versiforme]|uniref:ATP-grasp domain-containing protein n=1 Tax=Natrinema versiforme TaxID=88724 RepID=A0A4P8WI77_9EURY|nr:ATP-grasp domain-containing protein [Natrinema versiforme]QCS43147.1 ATP-grasp domain-containing protein [Natrinema versiforme]
MEKRPPEHAQRQERPESETEEVTVLVTAAQRKPALAIARTLGKREYEVVVASHHRIAQSFFSRYATHTAVYTDPKRNERAFVADLLATVARYDVDVLLPTDHVTTISVLRFRDRFASDLSIPAVEYETLLATEDKARLLSIADDIGIPTPDTHRPGSLAELEEIAAEIDYPAVIKHNKGVGASGVQYVTSPAELRSAYDSSGESTQHIERDWPLVQEYVPGETHDVNALFAEGEPRVAFTAHRTSTFPRSGGRAVITESTREPELVDSATRLLEHLEWHGVAEVEFKLDADGDPKLMEINPRIWGNIDLAIRAGVDFPALLCDLALTGAVTPPMSYAVGRKVIWIDEGLASNLWASSGRLDYARYVAREYVTGAETPVELSDVAPHVVRLLQLGARGARAAVQGGWQTLASSVAGESGA